MLQQNHTFERVSQNTIEQERLAILQEKCLSLHKKNIKLEQENEVLRHCWDKARIDIEKLQRECQLLHGYLNAKGLNSDRPITKEYK
jgi:hypothetical protein